VPAHCLATLIFLFTAEIYVSRKRIGWRKCLKAKFAILKE
jgi:hypothetical protein